MEDKDTVQMEIHPEAMAAVKEYFKGWGFKGDNDQKQLFEGLAAEITRHYEISQRKGISVKQAMDRISHEIHEDSAPGSYRHGWVCNIAMPILDRPSLDLKTHAGANQMAEILVEHFFGKKEEEAS